MIPASRLTEAEEERLLDELLDVLDQVLETSGCRDMAPLWLIATQRVRAEWITSTDERIERVPERILALGKSTRSKYAALAAWRHAVLSAAVLDSLERRPREAVEAMYFQPYDRNEAPYSWSAASSRCPSAESWPSPSALDALARRGCAESVRRLAELAEDLPQGADLATEVRAAFLRTGARDGTLKDVLRYESVRDREEK